MRGAALVVLASLLVAGCGAETRSAATTAATAPHVRPAVAADARAVRVVHLGGSRIPRTTLAGADLVVVSHSPRGVAALARRYPNAHFLLVGRSYDEARAPNVAGLLFREDEAAYLAGVVAGLTTRHEGALDAEAAWVGGRRLRIADAFTSGAQSVDGRIVVDRAWTRSDGALCKEAALDAVARGASVILTGSGRCSEGALAGARDQNAIGLSLRDFERPDVAVDQFVRDAQDGLYHGGENVVFGAKTGAVGIRRLDPRVPPDAAVEARVVEQQLAAGLRSARGGG